MSNEIAGTSVGSSNLPLRLLVIVLLGICALGVFAYTNGLANYSQAAVDFSPAKHIPTRSGTQATPTPAFNAFSSPLTAAYITGQTSYPPDGTAGTGLYVCAISTNASSLYCARPNEFKPLADGSFNFSITLPPGSYYVYSAVPGTEYEAYYDSGVGSELIPVVVGARVVVSSITPIDWSAP